jgi:hypothetical protein
LVPALTDPAPADPVLDSDPPSAPPATSDVDPLADFLTVAGTGKLPEPLDLEPIEPLLPRRPALAAALRDALAHVRVDWG